MTPDASILNDRQLAIVSRVTERGFVTIDQLAREMDVSAQTIRREIIRLDDAGFLQRFHGGAGRPSGGERLPYAAKQTLGTELKLAIGQRMAREIRDGQAVYIDVGTTAEAVARALLDRRSLTVVTNSLTVARLLGEAGGIRVIATGGVWSGADGAMTGTIAVSSVTQFRLDWAIVACSGIDGDGMVLDFDDGKIAVKRAAMAASRSRALVCDSSKFHKRALEVVAPLSNFDFLVTDQSPPEAIVRAGDDVSVLLP